MFISGTIEYSPETSEAPDYIVHIPALSAMTQGYDLDDAFDMALDLLNILFQDSEIKDYTVLWVNRERGIFRVYTPESDKLVGLIIKSLRQAKGYSQKDLAQKLGLDSSLITDSEAGLNSFSLSDFETLLSESSYALGLDIVTKDRVLVDHSRNTHKEAAFKAKVFSHLQRNLPEYIWLINFDFRSLTEEGFLIANPDFCGEKNSKIEIVVELLKHDRDIESRKLFYAKVGAKSYTAIVQSTKTVKHYMIVDSHLTKTQDTMNLSNLFYESESE